MHIHIFMHSVYMCVRACVRAFVYVYAYIYVCVYTCIPTYAFIHTHISLYAIRIGKLLLDMYRKCTYIYTYIDKSVQYR
jgi:hypothetical protein